MEAEDLAEYQAESRKTEAAESKFLYTENVDPF
jgi:hypothetical protein